MSSRSLAGRAGVSTRREPAAAAPADGETVGAAEGEAVCDTGGGAAAVVDDRSARGGAISAQPVSDPATSALTRATAPWALDSTG